MPTAVNISRSRTDDKLVLESQLDLDGHLDLDSQLYLDGKLHRWLTTSLGSDLEDTPPPPDRMT